jgi:hypothetical protein
LQHWRCSYIAQVAATSLASQLQKHEIESLRVQLGLKQDIIHDLERLLLPALCAVMFCPLSVYLTPEGSELTIIKDFDAGLLSSLERLKTAADSNGEMTVLNAQLISEVNQLRAAVASKNERISKLKVNGGSNKKAACGALLFCRLHAANSHAVDRRRLSRGWRTA